MPEKAAGDRSGSRQMLLTAALILMALLPLGYSVVDGVIVKDREPAGVFLERPDAKYDRCVKDTAYMRFHHWELLRTLREEVVRYGKRGELGLNKCRECHTSRERFCNRCHDAVSMAPDCFGCHYYP